MESVDSHSSKVESSEVDQSKSIAIKQVASVDKMRHNRLGLIAARMAALNTGRSIHRMTIERNDPSPVIAVNSLYCSRLRYVTGLL